MMAIDPKVVAYHEAGHAIAALVLAQLPIESVTIVEDDDAHGHVMAAEWPEWVSSDIPDPDGRIARFIQNEITALLAGPAAERQLTEGQSDLSGSDHLKAWTLVSWLVPIEDEDRARGLYGECESRAVAMLAANWSAVAALASALLSRGNLAGHEIEEVARPRRRGRGP